MFDFFFVFRLEVVEFRYFINSIVYRFIIFSFVLILLWVNLERELVNFNFRCRIDFIKVCLKFGIISFLIVYLLLGNFIWLSCKSRIFSLFIVFRFFIFFILKEIGIKSCFYCM